MLPEKIAFVDIETTGLSSPYDRIIEIGIVRVEENNIVQTYHSLINPQTHLPKEITAMTGITQAELENAPTFRAIKTDVLEAVIDCVFVAHNVRFDYGFIKHEFKRENISFSSRHFCSVKLSRLLYPTQRRHNLDALIERFGIDCKNRHRALDDAKVLFDFYQQLQTLFPVEKLSQAIALCMKKPSTPVKLHESFLKNLPEKPGVYIFYDGQNMPLYVGKSKNIKNRVLDHFSSDISSPTEMNISQQIERIETITTAGELGALFLESQLIKKLLPIYNKKSRIKRELIALKGKINTDGYLECILEPITSINPQELEGFLGFFKSRKQANAHLAELAKRHGLCEKLVGLESASRRDKTACFAYRLDRCKGACIRKENPLIYNAKCAGAFVATKIHPWPFSGPISIEEKEFYGRSEYFILDNWCLIGHVVVDADGNKKSNIDENVTFDLDLYHILKGYLKNPRSLKQIKQITMLSPQAEGLLEQ